MDGYDARARDEAAVAVASFTRVAQKCIPSAVTGSFADKIEGASKLLLCNEWA